MWNVGVNFRGGVGSLGDQRKLGVTLKQLHSGSDDDADSVSARFCLHRSLLPPQVRITLQCFASYHAVSSDQMQRILRALRYEVDRCTATVVLWSRCINREGIYDAFRELSQVEQRQVWNATGGFHILKPSCPLNATGT